ncbi:hypothetical protein TNCV_1509981 [Trichonephila clavipes]|nr:hypothetical protein TNCV_1509981 [Trichonephila clavipes]
MPPYPTLWESISIEHVLSEFNLSKRNMLAKIQVYMSNSSKMGTIWEWNSWESIPAKPSQWSRIARPMGRSDTAIRRYWQEWVENGRLQGHDGSDRPKAIAYQERRLIAR